MATGAAASALHDHPATLTYDEYIDWTCDPVTLAQWRQALGLSPRDTRLVLATYVFRYFPHEVIAVPTTRDREQVTAACRLLAVVDETLQGAVPTALHAALTTYRPLFQQWKEYDRQRVIHPFTEKYRQLRRLRAAPTDYYTRELKALIDLTFLRLISDIMALAGEEGLATLDDPDGMPPPEDATLDADYRAAAQTAFWTDATLTSDYIVPLLHAFAQRYRALVPARHDLHAALTEHLDLDIITQRLDRGTMSAADLLAYCRLLVQSSMELCVSVEPAQAARDTADWTRALTLWPPGDGDGNARGNERDDGGERPPSNEELLPLMRPFFTALFQRMDDALDAAAALR